MIETLKLAREMLIEARAWLESDAPESVWENNIRILNVLNGAIANEALNKKAENARELGLDYEPFEQEPATKEQIRKAIVFNLPLYTSPQPQKPDLLNALKRIVDEPNNTMSDGKALKEIIRIARAAIAKATGEQK